VAVLDDRLEGVLAGGQRAQGQPAAGERIAVVGRTPSPQPATVKGISATVATG
jgi:hypothetical protein